MPQENETKWEEMGKEVGVGQKVIERELAGVSLVSVLLPHL